MEKTDVQNVVEKSSWKVDNTHSKIGFSVRHMVISQVEGQFNDFVIEANAGEDFADTEVEVKIKTESVNTGVNDRDNHLRSADFFDAENHKEIKFKSTSLEKVNDEEFKLIGDLTIRGITKPIELSVLYGGTIKDPWGNQRAGFQVEGKLNRFDYNLKWNNLMETGGAVVGKTININCHVEMIKA